jgi:heptosyltransferase-1
MKILVIKPSSLGDVIHALRVVSVLRKSNQAFEIHWVIRKGLETIVEASGIADRHFLFERGGGLLKYLSLAKELRRQKYDYVLDMQGLLRSGLLSLLCGCPNRYGRADGREFSTAFYKCIGPKDRKAQIHAIDRLNPFLDPFVKRSKDDRLMLDFPNSVASSEIPEKKESSLPRVILFPESRRSEKVWPYFRQLAGILIDAKMAEVIVCGTQADEGYDGTCDLRGRLNLAELADALKNAALIISNDSAPLHLASALGRPVLGLFGPTESLRYGPYPQDDKAGVTISSPDGKMGGIEVVRVLDQVREMI